MKLLVFLAAVYLMSGASVEATAAAVEVTEAVEPYLLISTLSGIGRLNMNGSDFELIVRDSGVVAIDYHYERDLLFWVTDFNADLKFTSLSNKTRNITSLNIWRMNQPTGLAVDWINDLVYWVERSPGLIRVYDLNTKVISTVLALNEPSTSMKLKIIPHLGLLYMGDRQRNGIYRIPVGGSRQPIDVLNVQCPLAIALSYKSGNIYTLDSCSNYMKSSKIDGSNQEIVMYNIGTGFVYGSSTFEDKLFWTQASVTSSVRAMEMNSTTTQDIFTRKGDIFNDVMAVHSSNQPPESVLEGYGLCEVICHHGDCMQSGLCSCNEGWTGLECLRDIDECQVENGGCVKTCVNLPGTFQCECEDGEELLPDKKGCMLAEPGSHTTPGSNLPPTTSAPTTSTHSAISTIEVLASTETPTTPLSSTDSSTAPLSTTETTTTSLSTTETQTTHISSTEMPTTPLSTTETTTTPLSSTDSSTAPLSTTETTTTSLSTTETQTTHISSTEMPTTPLSTTETTTTSLSTTETQTTPISSTEMPTTSLSTTETPTTRLSSTETPTPPMSTTDTSTTPLSNTGTMITPPSNSNIVTSSNDQDGTVETGTTPSRTNNAIIDQTTTNSEMISRTKTNFTQKEDGTTSSANDLTLSTPDEDSFKSQHDEEKRTKKLIIGVVTSIAGLIIFAVVLFYTIFLYVKCKQRKTGSYNVYGRQNKLFQNDEPGTMSVHNSFIDVSDFDNQYNHECVSENAAELGCAGLRENMEERSAAIQSVPVLGCRREENNRDRGLLLAVSSRLTDNCQTL